MEESIRIFLLRYIQEIAESISCIPARFTTSPSFAIPKALAHAGVQAEEVDFYELNEAFSVVGLANIQLLELDPAKVNVWWGCCAGAPVGGIKGEDYRDIDKRAEAEGGKDWCRQDLQRRRRCIVDCD
ncbi:Thiolase, C-terminal domain-containing protein [Endogone sp. FLAS-F59071]|nr:Thiolase, C-terminal domain-containing protein [Endogone sp. FLAS-F59071]|eukprot:RUS14343.1 Thiolase, C-terminal domain-containing protein [Endogone sp. FLAS-F59071]